jgi:hypothetical protein
MFQLTVRYIHFQPKFTALQIQSTRQTTESSTKSREAVIQSDDSSKSNQLMDDPDPDSIIPATISNSREKSSWSNSNTNAVSIMAIPTTSAPVNVSIFILAANDFYDFVHYLRSCLNLQPQHWKLKHQIHKSK